MSQSLTATLREAVQASDKTVYQLAKECHLQAIHISRFLRGERDLRLSSADKLAQILGLSLRTDGSRQQRKIQRAK